MNKTVLKKDIKIFAAAIKHLYPIPSDSSLVSLTFSAPPKPEISFITSFFVLTGQPQIPRPRRSLTVKIKRKLPLIFRKPQLNATYNSTKLHTMSKILGITREEIV